MKAKRVQSKETKEAFLRLIEDEKRMKMPTFENRQKKEKAAATLLRKKSEKRQAYWERKKMFDIKGAAN